MKANARAKVRRRRPPERLLYPKESPVPCRGSGAFMKTTALRGNCYVYVDFSEGKLLVQIIPVKWIVQVLVFPAKNIDVRASCDDIRLTIREGVPFAYALIDAIRYGSLN